MRSMTGFGAAEEPLDGGRMTVEVRSVNGRGLDVRARLPDALVDRALLVEQRVRKNVRRGRVEVSVRADAAVPVRLDKERARSALRELSSFADEAGTEVLPLSLLSVVPDLFVTSTADHARLDVALGQALDRALDAHTVDCQREGRIILDELRTRTKRTSSLVATVSSDLTGSLEETRSRFQQRLLRSGLDGDPGRLATEVSLHVERVDASEEAARLEAHVQHLSNLLEVDDEVSEARRLDFLLQEMLRETSTLAAKSQSVRISETCIDLKVEIERMREQVQNVE